MSFLAMHLHSGPGSGSGSGPCSGIDPSPDSEKRSAVTAPGWFCR